MVWRRKIKTKQPKNGCDQTFGLAERQAENRPQRQRRRDRQRRVARLATTRAAGLGLPRRNRGFREPHGQAPALAQRDVIGSPIRHSEPLLRSEEHTSELQSHLNLVCRLLLEKKKR